MNPKEKIVKNISSKLYIYFNNKYKEQLIKIGLNESGIESIVIVYSGKHYFPIANLMGEDIENNSCQLMIKHFS